MSRIANLRTLGRYNVVRVISSDFNTRAYRVKPRGFETTLFEITKPEGTAQADFDRFMRAVELLCDAQVK